MATSSTHVRVGVNFAFSGEEDLVYAYSTVDPNDLIVAKWHLIRPGVVDVIKQLPWAVLSVVRGSYGPFEPSFNFPSAPPRDHPIILVGAPAGSRASWQGMAEQIYSLCRNARLEYTRILFESVRYPLTEPGRAHFPKAAELAENVPMGSKFGPVEKNTQSSASMGGTIKLQGNDEEEPSVLFLSVAIILDSQISGRPSSNQTMLTVRRGID